jgi:predicted Zn-dependent peptidase
MYEGPGTSGLSHMFEHMMFKGTRTLGTRDYKKEAPMLDKIDSAEARIERLRALGAADTDTAIVALREEIERLLNDQRGYVVKDEIWQLYQNNGGTNLNAWTGDDMTAYIVTLPKNKVELFYWIEADRMRSPVLREFPSEHEVVTEERRMRYENRPIGAYFERLNALFYIAHPYRLPTIGWMSDIRSYTRVLLSEHVKRFYTPDNALIVLAGNIDPVKALADVRRYFGRIPRAAHPKREVVTREPPPVGETRFTMYDNAQPRIDIMYHIPGYPDDDLYQLDVMQGILSGRSGRLYGRLVTGEGLCTDAGAENAFRLHNGEFRVWATLKNESDPAKVEKILLEELARLTREPPTETEMLRNKNAIRFSFVTGLRSLEGLSDRLAWFERLRSWRDLFDYTAKIESVTAASVPAVAKRYLGPDLKTVGLLLNRDKDTSAPGPGGESGEE